jgi:hypothetical protein
MRSFALTLLSPLLATFACNRPSLKDCEQLCRRYGELNYLDDQHRDLSERRARWGEMQNEPTFLRQLDNCVTQCRFEGGTKEQVACVASAGSAAQARLCFEDG